MFPHSNDQQDYARGVLELYPSNIFDGPYLIAIGIAIFPKYKVLGLANFPF